MVATALADAELLAQKKKAKATSLGASNGSIHASNHKKPRRSHRPIPSKGTKSNRLVAEGAAKVVAQTYDQMRLLTGRLKLLEKVRASGGSELHQRILLERAFCSHPMCSS
jgi:hypothetical protein